MRSDEANAHNFFRLLALCHTVMPDQKEGKLEYQAQSPDEAALVSAARNFGFVFKSRTPSSISIEVRGKLEVRFCFRFCGLKNFSSTFKAFACVDFLIRHFKRFSLQEYELLNIIDFNNTRKRMSVILRRNNRIILYCKGADNVIYDRLGGNQNDVKNRTQEHLNVCDVIYSLNQTRSSSRLLLEIRWRRFKNFSVSREINR